MILPPDWHGIRAHCTIPTGQIVPRLRADIGIGPKKRGGQTYGIDLIRQPMRRRYWGHRDGSYSAEVPEATATYIAEHVRRWLPMVDLAMGHDAIPQIHGNT